MPVLREIVAKLGLDLDENSFKDAERKTDRITKKLDSAGRLTDKATGGFVTSAAVAQNSAQAATASLFKFFGAAAVGFGALRIVEFGSDAQETLNVLDASFQDSSKAVQDWASEFAGAAGRSEFELREMAGTLGAVLNPLMDRNADAAASMSVRLSELAVDLGSFFNAADSDALEALRSGIVGEAEPLKRFGIVMLESTLQAFALSEGINKSVASMSIAEKTALRYRFILDQTQIAQGDAARTSEGWANASKGLITSLKDLGTRLGLTILPFAEKVVITIRNATRAFNEWQQGTEFLKAALIVLGAIGTKVALGLLLAWAPVVIPILKFIAIVAVAALVLEDLFTLFAGGDSVIGRFIDAVFGPGSATAAVLGLKDAWAGMILFWQQEVIPTLRVLGGLFTGAAIDARQAWDEFFSAFGDLVLENQKRLLAFSDTIRGAIDDAAEFLGISVNGGSGTPRQSSRGTRGTAPPSIAAAPLLAAAGAGAAGGSTVSQSVTVQVQGNATARDAGRIADTAAAEQARMTRRTRAALTQRGS